MARKWGAEIFVAIYAGFIVTASITAAKIITIFGINVPAAVLVYSVTFLITDILAEIYGKEKAMLAVKCGVIVLLFYMTYVMITVWWPAAQFFSEAHEYDSIVKQSVRVTAAGLLAFCMSQSWDIALFHFFKRRHGSSLLWLRNNLSTASSQLIDTLIFISVAFWGIYPVLELIISQYIIKLIIAASDTPFLYLARRILGTNNSR